MYSLVRFTQPSYRSSWAALDQELKALFASAATDLSADVTRSISLGVHEDKDNLQVSAELPGVARDDINLELTDDVLSLSAVRKVTGAEGEGTVSYARSFSLPYPVQAEKITAELKDGVLRLTLPKAEAVKPRKIVIN